MGYNFVIPRLAQGSVPTGTLPFHAVVLSAEELQDVPLHGMEIIKAPLDDAKPSQREIETAYTAASMVVGRWRRGRHVLVTCAQGRNRSGLIVGLALMMLGMTDQQAVQAVRGARGPTALSNRDFVRVLTDAQRRRCRPAYMDRRLPAA
jgi:hypothetical protein